MIYIAKNKFLVEVDSQFDGPNIPGFDFIDTDYNPKLLSTKIGKIHSLPISIDDKYKYDVELNIGDTVVFDHLVCQDANRFSDTLFFCEYFNIYAKIVDGVILPLEEVIFCDKIVEPGLELGSFSIPSEVSDKKAKVYATSKFVSSCGIQKGDTVYFTKNADYTLGVGGREFFKMYLRNIIGIERDGKLETFRQKLLVKNITELGTVGILDKVYADTSLQVGVVMEPGKTSIKKGATVTYFNASATEMEWDGEKYGFINEENIKYIVK